MTSSLITGEGKEAVLIFVYRWQREQQPQRIRNILLSGAV
jgi:hypothetical protein